MNSTCQMNEVSVKVDMTKETVKRLLNTHPVLPILLSKGLLNKHCFIAGGAILEAMIESGTLTRVGPKQPFDIDIFCCFPCDMFVLELLSLLKPYSPQAYIRNDTIITILTEGYPNIQVTYCLQQECKLILESFDLACCQVMFDGTIKGTDAFAKVLESGWKEDLTGKKVAKDRVKKYRNRGVVFSGSVEMKEPLNQKYVRWFKNSEDVLSSLREYCPSYKRLTFPLAIPEHKWLDGYANETQDSIILQTRTVAWSTVESKSEEGVFRIRPDDFERIMIVAEINFEDALVQESSIEDLLLQRTSAMRETYSDEFPREKYKLSVSGDIVFAQSAYEDLKAQVASSTYAKRAPITCLLILEQKMTLWYGTIYFTTRCTGVKLL